MKTEVYVVTMRRWGDDDTHNYVQGVFTKKAQAEKAGEAEQQYRNSKYEPKITVHILDEHDKDSMDYFKKFCEED